MVKYTLFNYEDKTSVKRFYSFYQNFLLTNFMFEQVGSYQSFIEKLCNNSFYEAIIAYDEKELGGVIFEYEKDSNVGFIHYLETNNNDLNQMSYDFATYKINERANDFYSKKPEIVQSTHEIKQSLPTMDITHNNEYFLKKLVIPSINKNINK